MENLPLLASDGEVFVAIFGVAVAGAISMLIASCAAGDSGGTALWGLLGPFGWLIAAIRGVQVRVDDLTDAVHKSAPPRPPAEAPPGDPPPAATATS